MLRTAHDRYPSISLVSHKFGDDPQPKSAAKVTCGTCDATQVIPLTGPLNPHHVAERFRRNGWEFGHKTRCPTCQRTKRSHKRDRDPTNGMTEPLRLVAGLDVAAHQVRREPDPLPPSPVPRREAASRVAASIASKESAVSQPTAPKITPTPRDLTPDERAKVRRKLDEFFDDQAGRYLEGYSDEIIGRELNLPFASVARYRVIAYGELKADDDLDRLLAALAKYQHIAEQNAKIQDKNVRDLRADIETCKGAIDRQLKAALAEAIAELKGRADRFEQAIADQNRINVEEGVKLRTAIMEAGRKRGLKI